MAVVVIVRAIDPETAHSRRAVAIVILRIAPAGIALFIIVFFRIPIITRIAAAIARIAEAKATFHTIE
jgi:hypothetical protein